VAFRLGQFVVLTFAGLAAGERHPFSMSSGGGEGELDVTVASGDYTARLVDSLGPGDAARVLDPFGGFDYRDGGQRQIWIAGGIGVTPFISWIRSLDSGFAREVEFWHSVRDPATLSIATRSRRPRGSIRRCACISSSPMPTAR